MFVLKLRKQKKEECEKSREFIFGLTAAKRNLFDFYNLKR
jgi:hypothetical protein